MFYNAYCVDVITYDCYKDYYYINQKHFGYIADLELTEVKPIDIQNCLKSTLSYSNDRQRRSYFLLKRVFREAIVNGYCDKNPCDYVKPPKRIKKKLNISAPIISYTSLMMIVEFAECFSLTCGQVSAVVNFSPLVGITLTLIIDILKSVRHSYILHAVIGLYRPQNLAVIDLSLCIVMLLLYLIRYALRASQTAFCSFHL